MQSQSTRPVKTFSIGFQEAGYNEAIFAKAVAEHLGTDHTELYIDPAYARAVIPRIPVMYDEPFADASQIPTFLVAEMTRRHVTVALSGDGGDELFGGYDRYIWAAKLWGTMGQIPVRLRKLGQSGLKALSPQRWNRLFDILPRRVQPIRAVDGLCKLAELLGCEDRDALYRNIVSQWQYPSEIVLAGTEPRGVLWDSSLTNEIPDFTQHMQYLDLVTYLPDDILTKIDRATMAVSLEGRVPILDHRVVEFAATLPKSFKIRAGRRKWLLRQVLARYVPNHLVDRPKMGFGVPIGHWLRGPLREWAEDLLQAPRLAEGGILRPEPIRRAWQEHLSAARNMQYPIWVVLMFQAWRREWAL
jgi:asparagine synthase (glutamine-hydrolysing)